MLLIIRVAIHNIELLYITTCKNTAFLLKCIGRLKEYYEIVGESRPLSVFSPTHAFFLQKCISTHETKQSSKFLSDPSPNCFTIDV